MAIFISVLALLLTVYQAYLQRLHNIKSLKPIGQIEVGDRNNMIYIHIQNMGMGPLQIDKLIFSKGDKDYTSIRDCLNLDAKTYLHVQINDDVKKVVLPNSHFIVFEKNTEKLPEDNIEDIRKQLTRITLKVTCRDIYDNKFNFERHLRWFSRHLGQNQNEIDKKHDITLN